MNRICRNTLNLVVPEWIRQDICNRLTHPYWRRQEVPLPERDRAIAIGDRFERTSSRRPFKRVDEKRVLAMLRLAGARWVLDIGCGVGNLVRHLESLGFEATGISVNPQEIEQAAHERIHLVDIQADLAGTPLEDATFDAIVSFDCLEHLERPLDALRNINRLLDTGGLFVAHLPPARWTECDYHVICYTPRQFRWLLNLTGFDLDRKQGRHRFSKIGVTYYARKRYADRMVYPGVLE
jgi:2-polyprenyl-3-methyl-5-hydroxy-6-metoxy-1,4-benzoquinol methylase